ncbi:WD40 repeat-like protein [Panus rudis PR-1116 ss-1]|nr:WD40 repeat-like protein [Panus rudis PR-1116 ss-1]
MLAACTSSTLTVIDAPTLKKAPAELPPSSAASEPTASAWSPDNSQLYLALSEGIQSYSSSGEFLKTIYVPSLPVTSLICREKGNTLVFSTDEETTILDAQSGKVARTLNTHKAPVTSLSLSNDSSLLASTTHDSVHVHNLSLASHAALRGVPSGELTTCSFHPHSRTRLLLGIGSQLVVYDTTRPSGPSKTIAMDKMGSGRIVTITCSPFSKTLVAVACSSGTIGLVDLEKEKGQVVALVHGYSG